MKKLFASISFVFLLVVVLFVPFQSLFAEVLNFHTALSESVVFWIDHWYEPIILLLFALILTSKLFYKRKFNISQILALSLLVLGVVSVVFISPEISRGFEGFRFTLFGTLFYLFACTIDLSEKRKNNIINIYLYLSILIALWAIIERVFPLKYWGLWGVISPEAVFGYGWHKATPSIYQSASFIGGPNQLASYLLPSFFLSLTKFNIDQKRINKYRLLVVSIILASAIFLTFSRSALVGLIVGFCIFIMFFAKKSFRSFSFSGLTIATLLSVWFLAYNPSFKSLLTHGGQTGHQTSFQITITEIVDRLHDPQKLFFGSGLGTAGPLVLKYGNGIISESWYLQLVLEIGIVGLFLWLIFICFSLKELFKKKETALFLSLISVSVTALFLHTFADNPALTYTLFILMGIALNSKESNDKNIN